MVLRNEYLFLEAIREKIEKTTNTVECLGRKNLCSWDDFPDEKYAFQPDIDMLLCKKVNGKRYAPLHAIECKVFYYYQDVPRLNNKYYAGLDQALALLNYGMDYVSLLHGFLISFEDFNSKKYEKQLENYVFKYTAPLRDIIKSLKLPIGYTAAYGFTLKKGKFHKKSGIEILEKRGTQKRPYSLIIEAKRNQMSKRKRRIRKRILSKFSINDDESMIKGPLLR